MHSHGYGGRCEVRWDWAEQGVNVLGVDIRGFGESSDAAGEVSRAGYVLTGIQSPETSILRAAVATTPAPCRWATSCWALRPPDWSPTGSASRVGWPSWLKRCSRWSTCWLWAFPPLAGVDGRQFFVKQGSGAELSRYLAARPQSAEDLALVLRYFDTMNIAPGVTCPTVVGLGLADDVVPAETVFAIANHLGGPHEVMEFPVSHSEHPDEQLWKQFDARCVALALEGPVQPG